MQFGLWIEPEMVNLDSDLYRAHPDWVMGAPGREQPVGRGQYVLDLGRSEVQEHLFRAIDDLVTDLQLDFLKWDMNRDMTHAAGLDGRPAANRLIRALYALIDRLRARHPALEIESCASGGARADYGILARAERIWTSDSNDPLERQRIQRGFSLFFPPEIMGCHVGPAESHTTGRLTTLARRAGTALAGHFGVELDPQTLDSHERAALVEWIRFYKRERAWLNDATLYPIMVMPRWSHRAPSRVTVSAPWSPKIVYDFQTATNTTTWQVVNDDVMGGISTSSFRLTNGVAVFQGEVSLENNGGFASVRSLPASQILSGVRRLCHSRARRRPQLQVYRAHRPQLRQRDLSERFSDKEGRLGGASAADQGLLCRRAEAAC